MTSRFDDNHSERLEDPTFRDGTRFVDAVLDKQKYDGSWDYDIDVASCHDAKLSGRHVGHSSGWKVSAIASFAMPSW